MNAVLLREPPVAAPDRLVEVHTRDDSGFEHAVFSIADYRDVRAATATFSRT